MSHVTFSVPKMSFFCTIDWCYHYALLFYLLLHKFNLLDFEMSLHKTRKNSEKWTRSMSKNEIDETLLGNSTRC